MINNRIVNIVMIVLMVGTGLLGDIANIGVLGDKATKWIAVLIALFANMQKVFRAAPTEPAPKT
jgi:hypothetical protein